MTDIVIPEDKIPAFRAAMEDFTASRKLDFGIETEESMAERLWPHLTTEDKFYLYCGLLSKVVAAKAQAIGCSGLSATYLRDYTQEQIGPWITHIECDLDMEGWYDE